MKPLIKSIRPRISQIFDNAVRSTRKCDLGPSWWTDGRLLIDTLHLSGCKEIRDRMLKELKESDNPKAHARRTLDDHSKMDQVPAIMQGYEPGVRIGYVCDVKHERIGRAFNADLLHVFRHTVSTMWITNTSLVGYYGSIPVGLLMPIHVPIEHCGLQDLREFFNAGRGAFPDQGCGS